MTVTRLTVAVHGCGKAGLFHEPHTATLENAPLRCAFSTSRLENAVRFPHRQRAPAAAGWSGGELVCVGVRGESDWG